MAKLANMNKAELAKSFGVHRQVVQTWAGGRFMPSRDKIIKLVKEYGFEYSDFFTEVEECESERKEEITPTLEESNDLLD